MIKDHIYYNKEMKKSLDDKLFFMNNWHIESMPDIWIDVGCADGQITKSLIQTYKENGKKSLFFFGVDEDETQEVFFSANCPNATFYLSLRELSNNLKPLSYEKTGVILSSVLHESPQLLHQVVSWIRPDFIVIRDMALSEKDRAFAERMDRIIKSRFSEGPNAEHESQETYFQLTAEDYESPPHGYITEMFEHKPYPWLVENVIPPLYGNIATHMYAIYNRKDAS